MPMQLEGSCHCRAVRFRVNSSAPYPYQLCYCSICRKTAGSGGYGINLLADAASLECDDDCAKKVMHATLHVQGRIELSSAERHFCGRCGSALWLYSPEWPLLLHPHASAIDSELPVPPERVHMMLGSKARWVQPQFGERDAQFEAYPEHSIEDWHRARGLWID